MHRHILPGSFLATNLSTSFFAMLRDDGPGDGPGDGPVEEEGSSAHWALTAHARMPSQPSIATAHDPLELISSEHNETVSRHTTQSLHFLRAAAAAPANWGLVPTQRWPAFASSTSTDVNCPDGSTSWSGTPSGILDMTLSTRVTTYCVSCSLHQAVRPRPPDGGLRALVMASRIAGSVTTRDGSSMPR